jgi:CubicO group peptidase (beta-lactamase class C family)
VTHGWGDLELQPRDMAKIGYLWLNEGLWDGKQLVPKTYLRAATALHFRNPEGEGYGYGFWVHPEVAGGIFEATGRGGQRITVLSSKRIVLAITGGGFDPGVIAKFLFDSVKSDSGPLPENPAAASVLRAATATASEAPATTARRRPGPRHRQPNHG